MKRLLFGVLLVSTIAASAPQLVRTVGLAASMRGHSYRERRALVMGAFYPSIEQVLRVTPPKEPLALVVVKGESRDSALFFDYYAYPRRTTIYAESAFYGIDGHAPKAVVRIGDVAALSSYGAMRLEDLQHDGAMVRRPILRDAGTHFFVPLAASIDGVVPARYTVEATLACDQPAQVTFTFRPKNLTRTLTIDGSPLHFDDLVYELFGVLDRGWLEVASTRPLRAAFALATHPRGADELPVVTALPSTPMRVAGGDALWLVNLTRNAAGLRINGKSDFVLPYDSVSRAYSCPCDVAVVNAEASVYAFGTQRRADGRTRFFWPEGVR
jgi:hypothetical protein